MRSNNLSPIPFYQSIDEQDFRKPWSYGEVPCLAVSCEQLLPFFFAIPSTAGVASAYIKDFHTGQTEESISQYLRTSSLGGKKCVYYMPQSGGHSFIIPEGRYYITVTLDNGQTLYSEVFTAIKTLRRGNYYDLPGYMRITWYDNSDFEYEDGFIPYSAGYRNWLFLPTDLGMPDYIYNEEATDRDGFVFVGKQTSEKRYKFTVKAPEFLLDAMMVIRLSDHIIVQDVLGRTYECDSFLVTPSWLDQGHYASVEGEFETETIVKKIGGGNVPVPVVPVFDFVPVDMLQSCNKGPEVILYKTTQCNLTPNDIEITYEDTGDGTSWVHCYMISDRRNIVRGFYFAMNEWPTPDKLLRSVQVTLSSSSEMGSIEETFIINQYKNPTSGSMVKFLTHVIALTTTAWVDCSFAATSPFEGEATLRFEDGSHFEGRVVDTEYGFDISVRAKEQNTSGLPYIDKVTVMVDGYDTSSLIVYQPSS